MYRLLVPIRRILWVLLFFLTAWGVARAQGERRHVVQPGETLYSIAQRYGVSLSLLQQANPQVEASALPTGTALVLPAGASAQPAPAPAPQPAAAVRHHVVQPSETLYSIAQRYGISLALLQQANPQVEASALPTGAVLVLPAEAVAPAAPEPAQPQTRAEARRQKAEEKERQKAEKKARRAADAEAAASNGRAIRFGDGAAAGTDAGSAVVNELVELASALEDSLVLGGTGGLVAPDRNDGVTDVTVILNFHLAAATAEAERQQRRAVEFYGGLLMAVDEAQQAGMQVAVRTFDLTTTALADVLADPDVLRSDLIVAPFEQAQADAVAAFGEEHAINVVSPMAFSTAWMDGRGHVFQLNTAKSMFYVQLADELMSRFADRRFVFLTDSTQTDKAEPFAQVLREQLAARGVAYSDVGYRNPSSLLTMERDLGLVGQKIFLVPVTAGREALERMFPCLAYLVSTVATEEVPTAAGGDTETVQTDHDVADVAMLGYPEWVLYAEDFMSYYYDQNVYMFAKFYANPFDETVQAFYRAYKAWYGKEPMPLYPRYALRGYDTGRYFLQLLASHGYDFGPYADSELLAATSLQDVMSFRQSEGGGFVNRAFYLVNFKPTTEIVKHVIR